MSQANTILTEEELSLVCDCAGRLRVIQGDAGAIDAAKRREYLGEEVSRSFKNLSPARRRPCLDSLLARFPVAGQLAQARPTPAAPPTAPVAATPEQLLERLVAVAGDLPEAQRAEFTSRLAAAGYSQPDVGSKKLEISPEVQARLGLPPNASVDLERLALLASLIVQTLADLDRAASSALKDLFPRSPFLSRSYDFRQTVSQYLSGNIDKIEPQLRVSSALLGGMLVALLEGGRDFGRQYVEKFSPDAIEEVVVAEGRTGVWGPNKKERCWENYCRLSKDVATPELMERWLKDCLGRFADSRIKGIR